MGGITDHAFENLAPSDQMIARTRRTLLLAARAWKEQKEAPPGADKADVYYGARAGSFLAESTLTLQQAYEDQLEKAVRFG
jgi:hypothetical protein